MSDLSETSLINWLIKFDNSEFIDADVKVQIKAGWYDWFCRDSSLVNKTKVLGKKIKSISKSNKFNNETSYIFFKNNCPIDGPLYDSFSICDRETNEVIFWITPKSGHTGLAEVVGINDNGKFETLVEGNWKAVKAFFK